MLHEYWLRLKEYLLHVFRFTKSQRLILQTSLST